MVRGEWEWYERKMLETTAKSLRSAGFNVVVSDSGEEAAQHVISLVPPGSTIGVGGSITIRELGLIERLERMGHRVIHHWVDAPAEEVDRLRRLELTADVFLSSANAITMDGKIVAVDGAGNRVAAMSFGPKTVILVAGVNKIVRNLDEALARARNVAAIMNWRRLGLKLPCVEIGRCVDCDSPDRGCRIVLILERRPLRTDYHVVLVRERLGF